MLELRYKDLTHKAQHQDGQHEHTNAIELNMSHLIVRVELENKEVVHAIGPKYLHIGGDEKYKKHYSEDEAKDRGNEDDLFPVKKVVSGVLWR